MARHPNNILLILPWSEPNKWVFQSQSAPFNVDVCSVPSLHVNRSTKSSVQSILLIAKRIQNADALVTWEVASGTATGIARRLVRNKTPWAALGIIPKYSSKSLSKIIHLALSQASVISCFSKHDFATLERTLGLVASAVTPTVWNESPRSNKHRSRAWLSVGGSNRDDETLARAAEATGILVNRFATKRTHSSPALSWSLNANSDDVESAFYEYRSQFVILQSAKFVSGLSVVVRSGFAEQLVIASDTPQIRELIQDRESGLLVRLGDVQHLAETIDMVQNGHIDLQPLVKALQDNCRDRHTYAVLREHITELVNQCM